MKARIGEVVRLDWPTVSGEITLVALTPDHKQLTKEDCAPDDEDVVTTELFAKLKEHAARPDAFGLRVVAERHGLRLLSSA